MSNLNKISNKNYEYSQYTDYVFKNTVQKYAEGVLKFLNIPYTLHRIISSEITSFGPQIHRLDFVAEVVKYGKRISLILECQSQLPSDDDIMRFFQYISSLRVFKNREVELYILCTKKPQYSEKEFVIKDDCIYTMKIISLKHFKASKILKNIEDKIKSNDKISEEDIAALQLIAYTDYEEPTLEILLKANSLVEQLNIDINEKMAIRYILDVLSTNMLNKTEKGKYMEKVKMLINPREEYFKNEGIKEGIKETREKIAKNLLKEGMSPEKISQITGLETQQIQNAK